MASPEQTDTFEQQNAAGVGALLKASRLRIGEELRDIAGILKIRYVFLEAIENGRFEELPGTTYTLGFVRAYAEHLGLDSDEVIRRFKNQESGAGPRSQLDFPEPITEALVPGGAVVFIGVVVAVLAYGAWYVNSSGDGFFKDLVEPLPERFAKMLGEPKAVEKAESEKTDPEKTELEPQADAKPAETTEEPTLAESQPDTAQQSKPEQPPESVAETVAEPAAEPKPEKIAEATPQPTPEATPQPTPEAPPESAEAPAPEKILEVASTETSRPAPEPSAAPEPAPADEPVLAPSVVPMMAI